MDGCGADGGTSSPTHPGPQETAGPRGRLLARPHAAALAASTLALTCLGACARASRARCAATRPSTPPPDRPWTRERGPRSQATRARSRAVATAPSHRCCASRWIANYLQATVEDLRKERDDDAPYAIEIRNLF